MREREVVRGMARRDGLVSLLLVIILPIIFLSFACSSAPATTSTAPKTSAPAPASTAPAPKPAASPSPAPVAKTIQWKMSVYCPPGSPPSDASADFVKRVKAASNGRLDIHIYLPDEIGIKVGDQLNAVKTSALDISATVDAYYTGTIEPYAVLNYMCLGKDAQTYEKIGQALLPFDDAIIKSRYNAFTLFSHALNMSYTFTKKPAPSFFDMGGMKIRTYSAEYVDFMQMLNGTGVSMPWGDVYEGLNKGVIDGWASDITHMESSKLYDVTRYFYNAPQATSLFIWITSQDSFNALPADLQKIVKDEADKTVKFYLDALDRIEADCIKKSKAAGVTFVEPPAGTFEKWQQMCREKLWPKWVAKLSPDGKKAFDTALKTAGLPPL